MRKSGIWRSPASATPQSYKIGVYLFTQQTYRWLQLSTIESKEYISLVLGENNRYSTIYQLPNARNRGFIENVV